MRVVSVLLSLGIVVLAWLAAGLLAPGNRWLRVLLPLGVALLPMHAFTVSVANNDVIAEVAASALFVALVALLRWPQGRRGWRWRGSRACCSCHAWRPKLPRWPRRCPCLLWGWRSGCWC